MIRKKICKYLVGSQFFFQTFLTSNWLNLQKQNQWTQSPRADQALVKALEVQPKVNRIFRAERIETHHELTMSTSVDSQLDSKLGRTLEVHLNYLWLFKGKWTSLTNGRCCEIHICLILESVASFRDWFVCVCLTEISVKEFFLLRRLQPMAERNTMLAGKESSSVIHWL